MLVSIRRAALWALVLGLAAAGLFSLHAWLRGTLDDGDPLPHLEQAGLAAGLTALGVAATSLFACFRSRTWARQLATQVTAFNQNPAAFTLPEPPPGLEPDGVPARLFEQVRGLCTLYHQ